MDKIANKYFRYHGSGKKKISPQKEKNLSLENSCACIVRCFEWTALSGSWDSSGITLSNLLFCKLVIHCYYLWFTWRTWLFKTGDKVITLTFDIPVQVLVKKVRKSYRTWRIQRLKLSPHQKGAGETRKKEKRITLCRLREWQLSNSKS